MEKECGYNTAIIIKAAHRIMETWRSDGLLIPQGLKRGIESVEYSKSANDMALDGYLRHTRARKTVGSNECSKCKHGTELLFCSLAKGRHIRYQNHWKGRNVKQQMCISWRTIRVPGRNQEVLSAMVRGLSFGQKKVQSTGSRNKNVRPVESAG
jgi:hypothetical protein